MQAKERQAARALGDGGQDAGKNAVKKFPPIAAMIPSAIGQNFFTAFLPASWPPSPNALALPGAL